MSFFILYFFFKNKTIIYLEGKNTNSVRIKIIKRIPLQPF